MERRFAYDAIFRSLSSRTRRPASTMLSTSLTFIADAVQSIAIGCAIPSERECARTARERATWRNPFNRHARMRDRPKAILIEAVSWSSNSLRPRSLAPDSRPITQQPQSGRAAEGGLTEQRRAPPSPSPKGGRS